MRPAHDLGVTSAHHLWRPDPYVAPAKRGWRRAIGARPDRAAADESIMNPRRNQEQIGLFRDFPESHRFAEVEAIRLQAVRARDAAIAAAIVRAFKGLGKALATVGSALLSWPERRATYENLRRLNDRELADIGLTRAEISRVFDPAFRMPRRAASTPGRAPAQARAQAA
jgi:uncharacterized protein YjiS (DUF1127 family)